MDGFDAYYAVYWNGHLLGHGHFVTDPSLSAARLTSAAPGEYFTSLCVGSVRDHNELLLRDRNGRAVLRRSFRKAEVRELVLVYKRDSSFLVTTRNGPMELE